jgi:hypothetical protein
MTLSDDSSADMIYFFAAVLTFSPPSIRQSLFLDEDSSLGNCGDQGKSSQKTALFEPIVDEMQV